MANAVTPPNFSFLVKASAKEGKHTDFTTVSGALRFGNKETDNEP